MGGVVLNKSLRGGVRQRRAGAGSNFFQLLAQHGPRGIHLVVLFEDDRRQRLQRCRIVIPGHGAQHGDQVFFFVGMVQRRALFEIFDDGRSCLLRLLVGAGDGHVGQQFFQCRKLFADAIVAMFEDGDRAVEAGRGVRGGCSW